MGVIVGGFGWIICPWGCTFDAGSPEFADGSALVGPGSTLYISADTCNGLPGGVAPLEPLLLDPS